MFLSSSYPKKSHSFAEFLRPSEYTPDMYDVLREAILQHNTQLVVRLFHQSHCIEKIIASDELVVHLSHMNLLSDALLARIDTDRLLHLSSSSTLSSTVAYDIERLILSRWIDEATEHDDPFLCVRIFEKYPNVLSYPVSTISKTSPRCHDLWKNLSECTLGHDLFEVIKQLAPSALNNVFTHHPRLVNARDKYENTFLHYSVLNDRLDLVRFFIERKIDVNRRNMWSLTPLNEAIRLGLSETADFLRDNGACHNVSLDSQQSVIGNRRDFFHLLEDLIKIIPEFFHHEDILFQLFHSVPAKTQLYCCSVQHASQAMNDLSYHTTRLIFDRRNTRMFHQSQPHVVHVRDDDPTDFLSPLCRNAGITALFTFPYFHGYTFLGYFVLWTKETSHPPQSISSFLSLFLNKKWTELLLVFPHLAHHLLDLDSFVSTFTNLQKKLASPLSKDFIPAVRFIAPIIHLFPQSDFDTIREHLHTLTLCHIPFHPSSIEIYDLLQALQTSIPPTPKTSFLLTDMYNISFCKDDITMTDDQLFSQHRAPCPLTPFDLFEIIGNHIGYDYAVHLERFNSWITMGSWRTRERELFEYICGALFPDEDFPRRKAVLGLDGKYSYRIFIPPSEIHTSLDYIFSRHDTTDYLKTIYFFFHTLLHIVHPLNDGNGRACRLFLSIILRSIGVRCIIDSHKKIFTLHNLDLLVLQSLYRSSPSPLT